MSSGGLGPDISQEELDFDELFLYNIPGQHQLSVGCDKGKLYIFIYSIYECSNHCDG